MSGYHCIVEAKNDADDVLAGNVAKTLLEAYPSHPWHVNIVDGLIIIKHMKLSSKWGMVRKYRNVVHDFKSLKHEIVMAAGEFLERAGLTRGEYDEGQLKRKVDGIPTKDLLIT